MTVRIEALMKQLIFTTLLKTLMDGNIGAVSIVLVGTLTKPEPLENTSVTSDSCRKDKLHRLGLI